MKHSKQGGTKEVCKTKRKGEESISYKTHTEAQSNNRTDIVLNMNQHTVLYACHWKVPCALRVLVEHLWARTRMEMAHADSRSNELVA
jgi:hypothetical protein